IRQDKNYGKVKALVDVGNKFKSREFNGIKIFKKNELFYLVEKFNINEIIIGKDFSKKEVDKIFDKFEEKNIRIKNLSNKINSTGLVDQITLTNLDFFNVINRPKINVKKEILRKKIYNKNILVTGAGGSIGSELCLQILKFNPKRLFLLEISEINLFNLINKIKDLKRYNNKIIKPILGNCEDKILIRNYFKHNKLDDIYHAAAYKHVNFGEDNSYSMLKNNIQNTKTLIDFSLQKKIKNFIFISSDKAVNPKSVLGYSKKIGECLIQDKFLSKKKIITKFTIVRFGNVIGSSGSVIPIFFNQLIKNQPLTVTSKKASRYFMSISEAVQLVINASYLNKGGVKIYALDMGKQINIYDIAKRIIRLSGKTFQNKLNPNGEVSIKITGLKKGEKLKEEITLGKNLVKTSNKEIVLCDERFLHKNLIKNLKYINKKYNFNLYE
ncbi:polysaccharide biosynthesis protein, partial [Candidatus Pelagibacter sp.]|uniref:polysaccharide biosynthesis protein n=1 Tax=Candidatus Pelagibacter sp. TaxID=2024849 RepID=UPI003F842A28